MTRRINTCKRYIWAELIAGRSVSHLSVLDAIGSIKCQQRIHDLRRELEANDSPYEIITTMTPKSDGGEFALYSLRRKDGVEERRLRYED